MSSTRQRDEHDPDLADYLTLPPGERLALARADQLADRPLETHVSIVLLSSLNRSHWPRKGRGTLDFAEEDLL